MISSLGPCSSRPITPPHRALALRTVRSVGRGLLSATFGDPHQTTAGRPGGDLDHHYPNPSLIPFLDLHFHLRHLSSREGSLVNERRHRHTLLGRSCNRGAEGDWGGGGRYGRLGAFRADGAVVQGRPQNHRGRPTGPTGPYPGQGRPRLGHPCAPCAFPAAPWNRTGPLGGSLGLGKPRHCGS